jgi:hypothetical protein
VGARPEPGSTGRRDQGNESRDRGGRRKFDHLAQYGRGRIVDEETGEYEAYEIPEAQGVPVSWSQILAEPQLIAADFRSEYGIRLADLGNDLSWREFATHVEGLLASDSRLARHLHAMNEEVDDDDG